MEVLADGRAPNPVTTPLRMVGKSISRPGSWVATSSSPTLLRGPDFSSVMPRLPLAPVLARSPLAVVLGLSCLRPAPVRLSQLLSDHDHGTGAHTAIAASTSSTTTNRSSAPWPT